MHAYEIPGLQFSLPAGTAIARRRFVTANASSAAAYPAAGAGSIGVSMDAAAAGQALTIADGIVMVDAGDAVTAGAEVEVGALGVAVTKTSGISVGIALTGATGAGQVIAVKMPGMGNGAATQTLIYTVEDLDAGADLADIPIGAVAGAGSITQAAIISLGSAAGVDAGNTSAVLLEVGSTAKASATYTAENPFPASGALGVLAIDSAAVAAGDVLSLSVTNGATANLPAFMVQIVVTLN